MANRALEAFRQNQSTVQNQTNNGIYKGIVEGVNDPLHSGRIKVRVYAIHGDYNEVDTKDLPWASANFAMRGNYGPPELFDRVWVQFENGNVNLPVYSGYWVATPDGSGNMPFNRRQGLETPRETWWYHPDNHPTVTSVFRTGEGDQLWVEDIPMGGKHHNKIMLQDAGGRFLRIRSIQDGKDYRPQGKGMKESWGPETVHRSTPSEIASQSAPHGEVTLGSGDFMLTAYSNPNKDFVMQVGMTSENNRAGISNFNGRTNRIFTGSKSSQSFVNVSKDVVTTQATKRVITNAVQTAVPEVW